LISQLITLWVTDINLNGISAGFTANYFNITYTPTTSDVAFAFTGVPYACTITMNFNTNYVIGNMFGFATGASYSFGTYTSGSITPAPVATLLAPNKVMVNPITSIYIRSESLKFESNYEAIVRNIVGTGTNNAPNYIANVQNSDVIVKIPVNTLPNSIIYYRSDTKSVITNKEVSDLNLYVSDNLSPFFNLDLQGLNYGIMVLLEEVTIPQLNQYKDKIPHGLVAMPTDLLEERKRIIDELKKQKEELEKEIAEKNKSL
jgi:hypothetical protein